MQIQARNPDEYISKLHEDRQDAIKKLREVIRKNLPEGFEEVMSYGMIGYVVPFSIYPEGYNADPTQPLPFINIASQKHHIAVYHMGVYAFAEILEWFLAEYPKHSQRKLDMGKSCIRFRKPDHIPYKLIGELAGKISVKEWINQYESSRKQTSDKR